MAEIVGMERSSGKESASKDQDPSLSIFYSLTIYNRPRHLSMYHFSVGLWWRVHASCDVGAHLLSFVLFPSTLKDSPEL